MRYGLPAVERAMKMQEIVLRAMSSKITWLQAADILGLSPRTVRRWRARYERQGYDGLLDRRHGRPSACRVPWPRPARPAAPDHPWRREAAFAAQRGPRRPST